MADYKPDNKYCFSLSDKMVNYKLDNNNSFGLNDQIENYKPDNKNCLLEQNPILPSKKIQKSCANCGMEFSSKQCLNRHERNCGRATLTPCSKCQKQFTRIDSLKRHIISCKKRRAKPSSCDTCKKVFRNNWFLRRHLPCKGSIMCPRCHCGFRKFQRYQIHYEQCCGIQEIKHKQIIQSQLGRKKIHNVMSGNESTLFLEYAVEKYEVKREDSFVCNVLDAHVNNSTDSNDEIHRFNDTTGKSKSGLLNNGMEEIKVYILDDNLLLTDESVCPDKRNEPENIVVKDENYSSSSCDSIDKTRLTNSRLADQICSNIKRVFNAEQINDVSTQLNILTLALENLGLYVELKDTQTKTDL